MSRLLFKKQIMGVVANVETQHNAKLPSPVRWLLILAVFFLVGNFVIKGSVSTANTAKEKKIEVKDITSSSTTKKSSPVAEGTGGGGGSVDSRKGERGGSWTWCTHIKNYGFNFDLGLATFLSYQLQPGSAFELGTGVGLYVGYLVRYGGVRGRVVGAEPEDMSSGGVYQKRESGMFPYQLTGNLFDENRRGEREALGKFDLVYTIEVAEHISASQHPALIDFLTMITGKYLVFSAARPRQAGTGHLPDSMFTRAQWIEKLTAQGKVVYLPKLSSMLLEQCDDYNSNHKINPIVFGTSINLDTDVRDPKLKRTEGFNREQHEATAYGLFPDVKKAFDSVIQHCD